MPTQMKAIEPVATREKVLSFCEEAMLITGIGVGSLIGGQVMMQDQASGMQAPGPFLHGTYTAVAIGLVVGKIAPIAISYLANRSHLSRHYVQASNMEHIEKACIPHMHKPSRLMGMGAGILMSAALVNQFNLLDVPTKKEPVAEPVVTAQTYVAPLPAEQKEFSVRGIGTASLIYPSFAPTTNFADLFDLITPAPAGQ